MAPRNSRTKKDVPSLPAPSASQPSNRPTPRGLTAHRAAPTTNEDKDRLVIQFNTAYDQLEIAKNELIAARDKNVGKAGKALDAALHRLLGVVEAMERFPPGGWDISRPNVINWIADLARVEVSSGLNRCRDLLFKLGQRIDRISRVTMYDEDDEDDDEEEVPTERVEQVDAVGEALYMENEIVCDRCAKRGVSCERRIEQAVNARCKLCVSLKQGCTNFNRDGKEKKPVATSQRKSTRGKRETDVEDEEEQRDDDEGEEEEEESPKASKGKGILGKLTRSFKRKPEDRSPEAPAAEKKTASRFVMLGTQPSTSSLAPTASQPPLSATPSMTSFDSQGSGSQPNFEAERYRQLYTASQENLALQQEQYEQELEFTRRRQMDRERRQRELFAAERKLWEEKLRALEEARRAEGRGPSGGGSRRG